MGFIAANISRRRRSLVAGGLVALSAMRVSDVLLVWILRRDSVRGTGLENYRTRQKVLWRIEKNGQLEGFDDGKCSAN